MKLSIVTTLYHSAPYIEEFYRRINDTARKITDDYEIIFVNDGSPDNALDIVVDLYHRDDKVSVIDLSRNFGHHKAMMTGLSYAQGDRVFLVDCDLEEEPELLERFWQEMDHSKEADVVYGVQEQRRGGWLEKTSGLLFYKLFNFLSPVKIPENLVTCRLMTMQYVKALLGFREQEIVIAGLWASAGFVQISVPVQKSKRGSTTYSLGHKLAILVNSITSFSNKPLVFIFYLGTLVTLFSFAFVLYLVVRKLVWGIAIAGWSSIVASIWFVGGVIIFSVGVLGIYLSKIFTETKNRPYTIIRNVHGRDE